MDAEVPGQRPGAGGGDGRGGGVPDIVGVVQEQDCGSGNAGVGRGFHRGCPQEAEPEGVGHREQLYQ